MIHYGWVIVAVWIAGAVGFLAGTWWTGTCRMNAIADEIIGKERNNVGVAKDQVGKG